MIEKLRKDNFLFGLFVGLLSTIVSALILLSGLYLFSMTINDNPKIFLFSFVAPIFLMRWYFKIESVKSARGVLIIIMLGMIALIAYLYKLGVFTVIKE
ncbi:MAG: hypothetical protein PHN41_05235 [Bacteroidales bacterium]|jgi:peptidoglycan/LPS O-acetylase OafA/YrhL|nr:hypothetical protein [Bacteroidales bacterium]MDD4703665.1 hypothetical protein [Bacteroidales bacterium]MDX9798270.1 hypothetical protein [Bacteroidales bacterium]